VKRRRIVFISFGWMLLLFQLMGYVGTITSKEANIIEPNIPFLIGFNLPAILGIVFFILANRLKHKIKRQMEKEEIDTLLNNTDD
jgi:hypothetical protein